MGPARMKSTHLQKKEPASQMERATVLSLEEGSDLQSLKPARSVIALILSDQNC